MNYWVFKANPDGYRIDERLLSPQETMVWSVTRYLERIQPGDTVFVWRGGLQPGFCGIMVVEACPYVPEAAELNDGFEIPLGSLVPESGQWAKCSFLKRFRTIEKSIVKRIPGLDLFSFFSAFQGAVNFSITRPEGARLMEYIETHPLEEPVKKSPPVSKPKSIGTPRPSVRSSSPKQAKPAAPAASSAVALLKCESCGRFVIGTDTERHVREVHAGLPVEWQKTR